MTAPATALPRPTLALLALLTVLAATPSAAQEPTALSVSPALPTTEDALILVLSGFGCAPQLQPPVRTGEEISWPGSSVQCINPVYWHARARLEPLPAGSYRARAVVDGEVAAELDFTVRPASEVLSLHGGRFRAFLVWQNPYGPGGGIAQAVAVSDLAGYFWFGGPANPEVTVKVLDGRGINGRYWVFAASLTTVGYHLVVTDIGDGSCLAFHSRSPVSEGGSGLVAQGHPPSCPERRYHQVAKRNRNFFDFQAFTDPL